MGSRELARGSERVAALPAPASRKVSAKDIQRKARRSELRERRSPLFISLGPGAVEGSSPSRGGHIAESLAEVTEARRSVMWEAARFQRVSAWRAADVYAFGWLFL